jgi:hypothetical protein
MTSIIGGTDTNYSSIAGNRLYLELTNEDKEFTTGEFNPLKYTKSTPFIYNDKQITYKGTISRTPFINSFSVLDKLRNDKSCSKFYNLVTKFNLEKLFYNNKSFFIPCDDNLVWNAVYEKLEIGIISVESFIRFHIVDYILTPVQLFGSIYRVETLFDNKTFLIDGKTDNKLKVIIENNIYASKDNYIIETTKTDNGWVYKIKEPLYPYIS